MQQHTIINKTDTERTGLSLNKFQLVAYF